MAEIIAKQPNGLYCRISTVTDAPSHWNMTKQEYINFCVERAKKDAEQVLQNYCYDFDCALEHIRHGKNTEMSDEEYERFIIECSEEVKKMTKDEVCSAINPTNEILKSFGRMKPDGVNDQCLNKQKKKYENCIHGDLCKVIFKEMHPNVVLNNSDFCPEKCPYFDDKTTYFKLPNDIVFEHSEKYHENRFNNKYEWLSLYQLKISIGGDADNLEEVRHKMKFANEDFLSKYPIPYKDVDSINRFNNL